jgi:hypothetical protein
VVHDAEAHSIHHPEGAHPALQRDHPGSIDTLEVAHAANEQLERGRAPGHEQAVDDVAAVLLANGDGHQADLLGELQQAVEHGRVGSGMAHDLADVRVPDADGEVQGEELLRSVDKRRQCARLQGRGVGSFQRMIRRTRASSIRGLMFRRRP